MESNTELKEIDIENWMFYYFDDIIKIKDFNLDNILIDEKSYENVLVCNITYKNLVDKPLCIRFDKTDYIISHDYGKIKVDSYDTLLLQKKNNFS